MSAQPQRNNQKPPTSRAGGGTTATFTPKPNEARVKQAEELMKAGDKW